MGCGASVEATHAGGAPTAQTPTGQAGSVSRCNRSRMHPLALCAVKPDGKTTFEEKANDEKSGTSETLNDKWGLSKAVPASIRYWTSAPSPRLAT